MSSFNFSSFSNLGNVEINTGSVFQKDVNRLECKPDNGKNGMYEFFGRFLPNPYDSSKSMIAKTVVSIKNPAVSGESVSFDCPKSIGAASFFFTLDKVLKKYENEPGYMEQVKEIRKSFRRWYTITSLMYVSQDVCHPENENKIKVFQYGMAIKSIIEEAQNGTLSTSGCKPFDLVSGKDFHYVATIKSKALGFADYKACTFMPQQTPFKYMYNGQYYDVTQNELSAMAAGQETPLVKLYTEQCPDMSRYEYEAPTQDKLVKAANYIRIIFQQYPNIFQEAVNSTDDKSFVELLMNAQQPIQFVQQQQPMQYGMQNQMNNQPQYGMQNQMMGQPMQYGMQNQMVSQQQQQYVAAPTVNQFGGQPQPQQNNLSEGGFIPNPISQPTQSAQDDVQTFGGGSDKFQEAIDNIF